VLTATLTGIGLGLFVAAQVGPIWLLCARSSLRHGTAVGLSIGAGAAIVDLGYAALGVAGAAQVLHVTALRVTLGIAGATFLAWLGLRTLAHAVRVRAGAEADSEVRSPGSAFRTALVATASNPMTIASWAAVFSAASVAHVSGSTPTAGVLVAGIGVGSFLWFAVLSAVTGRLGRRLRPGALRTADAVAGAGLVGFAALLGARTVRSG
jgi:threonine/homoserine/homoserine lactone efflux protein